MAPQRIDGHRHAARLGEIRAATALAAVGSADLPDERACIDVGAVGTAGDDERVW